MNHYNNASSLGKEHRLNRLFKNENIIILPIDDMLISGPEKGLKKSNDLFKDDMLSKVSAVLGYKGSFFRNNATDIEYIQNITASTTRSNSTNKIIVSSVEKAVISDAVAVASHINISSKYESNMLQQAGMISDEADKYGIPFFCLSYPRYENAAGVPINYDEIKKNDIDKYTSLVAHCVRIAVELGADIIKTQFTGSIESFSKVVNVSSNVPIVIAGGCEVGIEETLTMAFQALKAGARGISIGRNVYNDPNPLAAISSLSMIINDKASVQEALLHYKNYLR